MGGILGTGGSDARLASDLTLLAYLILIVPAMIVGFVFARRKMFRPYHKITMTLIAITNWAIILLLMVVSYSKWVLPFLQLGVSAPVRLLPTLHLITGGIAQILATYLVLLMWTEKTRFSWIIPKRFQTRNIKPYMRATLALWLVTAALGVTIFLTWYPPKTGGTSGTPVATEEPAATSAATSRPATTPEATVAPAATREAVSSPAVTEQAPVATPEATP
jgi:hypothetical protein